MAAPATMRQLLEAGVHFGHQTRRWNPKMKRFIFAERNGIYIIDLQQTIVRLEDSYHFVRDKVAQGGTVLFVGTKKQTQEPIEEAAAACGMPYVNTRWLGGTLTNFQTIKRRIERLQQLVDLEEQGMYETLPKKEVLRLRHEREKLEKHLSGIREMTKLPDVLFVIDTRKEHIAVAEARRLGIPIVAVVDTNCDPDEVDFIIPGNDDAIRAAKLMCRVMSEAVWEGKARLPSQVFEPDAEQEIELEQVPAQAAPEPVQAAPDAAPAGSTAPGAVPAAPEPVQPGSAAPERAPEPERVLKVAESREGELET